MQVQLEDLMAKKSQQVWMDPVPELDAWQTLQDQAITQALEAMPKEPEKTWEMLDRFFLEELARD
jgi:hypothetical protein